MKSTEMTIYHIDSKSYFDVVEQDIPIDKFDGILNENGDFVGGGTSTFKLPVTPLNEAIIEPNQRGIIRVVLQTSTETITGEMIVKSKDKKYYFVEVDDIRVSAFRRLRSLAARDVYLDDLDHTWSFENVIATRTSGWVYPFVDYGFMDNRPIHLQPRFFRGNIQNDIFNFRPAMFAYDFVQRAINQIGWDIDLPLGWFRQLIIPSSNPLKKSEGISQEESAAGFRTIGIQSNPPNLGTTLTYQIGVGANLNAGTGVYTATSPSLVNYRAMVTGENPSNRDKTVQLEVRKNGSSIDRQIQVIAKNTDAQIELTGMAYLNTGDTLSVQVFNANRNPLTNFPGAGSRFEIGVIDTLALGSTMKMSEAIPDVSALDLVKWVLGGINAVLKVDNQLAKIVVKPFNEHYSGVQSLEIDQDSWRETTIGVQGQNNYLSYSGEAFANGGFSVKDSRLPREKTIFASGFQATRMGAGLGGELQLAQMFTERPIINSYGDRFSLEVEDGLPRLLLLSRVNVDEITASALEFLRIGGLPAEEINYAFFFNEEISLSYNDDFDGISLTRLCFDKYASDLTDFKSVTALAKLRAEDVANFDFTKLVEFKNEIYRVVRLDGYQEGKLTPITLRRVGVKEPNYVTSKQIGTSGTTQAGSAQGDNIPVVLRLMNRWQAEFASIDDPLLFGEPDEDFQQIGTWGGNYADTGQAVIPDSGYYAIFFQVTSTNGEGAQVDEIWYEVLDSANTIIFERRFIGHSRVHNISNEEYLEAGWKITFNATFMGSATPNYDKSLTFATITQRAENG
jgi:hypothetical protein